MAKKLGYVFIDTGAMYRAITLFFLRNKINLRNTQEVIDALQKIILSFSFNDVTEKSGIYLNGENVELEIRNMPVSENVSAVSALKEVREFAVHQQQQMGLQKGIVMDGRDIGTTVFPNAELKIFVTASIEVRVERRYKELIGNNTNTTKEEVQANLEKRDYIDSHRDVSPLRQAADAIVLDNSSMTREEQLQLALNWVKEKIKK
jgi:cytidylate kinase